MKKVIFSLAAQALQKKGYAETDNCGTTTGREIFFRRDFDNATARLSLSDEDYTQSKVIEHPYGKPSTSQPITDFLLNESAIGPSHIEALAQLEEHINHAIKILHAEGFKFHRSTSTYMGYDRDTPDGEEKVMIMIGENRKGKMLFFKNSLENGEEWVWNYTARKNPSATSKIRRFLGLE